jgi:hypothetical protein
MNRNYDILAKRRQEINPQYQNNYNCLNDEEEEEYYTPKNRIMTNFKTKSEELFTNTRTDRLRNHVKEVPHFSLNVENYGLADMATNTSSPSTDPANNTNRKQHRIPINKFTNFNSTYVEPFQRKPDNTLSYFENKAQHRVNNQSNESYEANSKIPIVKSRRMVKGDVVIGTGFGNQQEYFEQRNELRRAFKDDYLKE